MKTLLRAACILLLAFGCGDIQEKFSLMMRISQDLSKNFNHHQINTSFGFGTETEDNHLTVTFFNFPIDSVEAEDFEGMATRVSDYLFEKYPEISEMKYVEVVFSEGAGTQNGESFYSYKRESKLKVTPKNLERT